MKKSLLSNSPQSTVNILGTELQGWFSYIWWRVFFSLRECRRKKARFWGYRGMDEAFFGFCSYILLLIVDWIVDVFPEFASVGSPMNVGILGYPQPRASRATSWKTFPLKLPRKHREIGFKGRTLNTGGGCFFSIDGITQGCWGYRDIDSWRFLSFFAAYSLSVDRIVYTRVFLFLRSLPWAVGLQEIWAWLGMYEDRPA